MNKFPELFISYSFWTKSVGISLRFWPRKRLFGGCFCGPCARYFSPRFMYCHYQTRQTAMNQFPELFISDRFWTKSVGIKPSVLPRKRLFGVVFGVPVLVIFRRGFGIVTIRLFRLQWTNFRNFLFRIVFGRNPWVLAFGFGPGNCFSGQFLGSLCSLFFAEVLVFSLPDSADCNKPVSGTFYFGQFLDEIRGY